MKKLVLVVAVAMVLMVSCKKETKEEIAVPTMREEIPAEESAVRECYSGIIKKDTILLSLSVKNSSLEEGELHYNFFEKDKAHGTLTGTFKGDTLFADYAFMSEGKQSFREVIFLKKGNIFIEGYGDVEEKGNKTVFKDKKKLFFDSKIVLSKTDCK